MSRVRRNGTDMADVIKTPFGTVPKKKAMIGGAIAAVILAVVVYRARQNAATSGGAIPEAEINPATGYPYGSAEDAAALAQQAGYISAGGSGGGGGGGGGVTIPGEGFVNNAQWSQAVIQYMTDNGLVEDSAMLAGALGKYLSGKPLSDAEESLVQQAIAIEGKPPVSGSDGYPPSIRKLPTGTTPSGTVTLTAPTGYKVLYADQRTVTISWTPVNGALYYEVQSTSPLTSVYTSQTGRLSMFPLLPGTAYHWHIRAVGKDGTRGPWTQLYQTTTKKPGQAPYVAA